MCGTPRALGEAGGQRRLPGAARSRSRRSAVPRATTVPACSGALSSLSLGVALAAAAATASTRSAAAGLPPAEHRLDLVAFPGYAEAGGDDPRVNWVHAVRPEDRLQGARAHRAELDRAARRGRPGHLRRRRRLRRRHPGADRRQGGAADRHRPDPELRRRLPGAEDAAAEPRARPHRRHPARPRRRPAALANRPRPPGAHELGRPLRPALRRDGSGCATRRSPSRRPRSTSATATRTSSARRSSARSSGRRPSRARASAPTGRTW